MSDPQGKIPSLLVVVPVGGGDRGGGGGGAGREWGRRQEPEAELGAAGWGSLTSSGLPQRCCQDPRPRAGELRSVCWLGGVIGLRRSTGGHVPRILLLRPAFPPFLTNESRAEPS